MGESVESASAGGDPRLADAQSHTSPGPAHGVHTTSSGTLHSQNLAFPSAGKGSTPPKCERPHPSCSPEASREVHLVTSGCSLKYAPPFAWCSAWPGCP